MMILSYDGIKRRLEMNIGEGRFFFFFFWRAFNSGE